MQTLNRQYLDNYYFNAGGRTIWPFAGVTAVQEVGNGLFWHNLFRNEDSDLATTHMACRLISGSKWIGNKWIGYNSQWNTKNCGLSENDSFNLYN